MEITIFYSWQGDLNLKTNKYFIERVLKRSISTVNNYLNKNLQYSQNNKISILDQATRGLKGSTEIASSIFTKIKNSQLFIADVSIVVNSEERKFPNPNVLIELGFAASTLGWENLILIFNTSTGKIEDLPFDIRGRRILDYNLINNALSTEIKSASKELEETIALIISEKIHEANPIEKHPIVKIYVYIHNRISDPLRKWDRLISDFYNAVDEKRDFKSKITLKEIKRLTSLINPIKSKPKDKYLNWFEYIADISSDTSKKINEIFLFQDKIDFDLIELISKAESVISSFDLYNIQKEIYSNSELEFLSSTIFKVRYFLIEALNKFHELYKEHEKEYHKQFSKHVDKLV